MTLTARRVLAFSGACAALLGLLGLNLVWGSVAISAKQVFAALSGGVVDETAARIVRDLRLPRAILVALVGAGLGAAGTGFQALFRNPLADPFVIGASSGAALGATAAIVLGAQGEGGGLGPVALAAFLGALGAVTFVYLVGELRGQIPTVSFLLAGVAVSAMLSAGVSLLIVWNDRTLAEAYFWLMGGFSGRGWRELSGAGPYLLTGMVALGLLHRLLDVFLLGDDVAKGLGVNLRLARGLVIGFGTLVTAAAVASSGVIGFVGLIAPHLGRALVGARHAWAVPFSALLGASLLLAADALSRTVVAPMELPIGIITSAIGGPFFLALLFAYPAGFPNR